VASIELELLFAVDLILFLEIMQIYSGEGFLLSAELWAMERILYPARDRGRGRRIDFRGQDWVRTCRQDPPFCCCLDCPPVKCGFSRYADQSTLG